MKFNLIIHILLCGFFTLISGQRIHAQITLKPYEDKSIGGYESIIFEYEEQSSSAPGQQVQAQKVRKEFDIEANNPFNKLGYDVKATNRKGTKVYSLGKADAQRVKSDLGLPKNFPIDSGASLFSYHKVVKEGDYVVVSYNSIISSEGDFVEEGRSSSIVALNAQGEEFFKLENLPYDVYSMTISENGKYVAFASGEYLEHSNFSAEPMFHIYETKTEQLHYQEKGETRGTGSLYGMITIANYGQGKFRTVILDQHTGSIYELHYNRIFIRGYGHFKADNQELTFTDLNQIR